MFYTLFFYDMVVNFTGSIEWILLHLDRAMLAVPPSAPVYQTKG